MVMTPQRVVPAEDGVGCCERFKDHGGDFQLMYGGSFLCEAAEKNIPERIFDGN